MLWGPWPTEASATELRGTVPPRGVVTGMERRASRLSAALPSPRTTTSSSRLEIMTVVAVLPVSSERTAMPMEAAVRPYWAAASRFTVTFTWGTCTARELLTSMASGSWEIRSARSSAIMERVA